MALIVEDGTGVPNANTYIDREHFLSYAAARGQDIVDDDPADVLLIKAMDYLQGIVWKGEPMVPFQPTAWPRQYVYVGPDLYPSTTIPQDVVNAQCELAIIVNSGVDLFPTFSGGLVTEDTVGPLTTKYSDKYGPPVGVPNMPSVSRLLNKWIVSAYGFVTSRA